MKRPLPILLSALMLMVLVSCADNDSAVTPSGEQVMETTDDSGDAGEADLAPGIEEVEMAYHKAVEAFYWFHVTSMPHEDMDLSDSSTYREADGMIYARVDHNHIKTCADLNSYLHSLFAGDIVAGLFVQGGERYRDFDGELYTIVADRGTDLFKGAETLAVTQESDVKIICTVQVELLDLNEDGLPAVAGYETHEYCYELVDGNWIFTNFYLFR